MVPNSRLILRTLPGLSLAYWTHCSKSMIYVAPAIRISTSGSNSVPCLCWYKSSRLAAVLSSYCHQPIHCNSTTSKSHHPTLHIEVWRVKSEKITHHFVLHRTIDSHLPEHFLALIACDQGAVDAEGNQLEYLGGTLHTVWIGRPHL